MGSKPSKKPNNVQTISCKQTNEFESSVKKPDSKDTIRDQIIGNKQINVSGHDSYLSASSDRSDPKDELSATGKPQGQEDATNDVNQCQGETKDANGEINHVEQDPNRGASSDWSVSKDELSATGKPQGQEDATNDVNQCQRETTDANGEFKHVEQDPNRGASSDWSAPRDELSATRKLKGQEDATNDVNQCQGATRNANGEINHVESVSSHKADTKENGSNTEIKEAKIVPTGEFEPKDEKQQQETGSNSVQQKETDSNNEMKTNEVEVDSNNEAKPENHSDSGSDEIANDLTSTNDNKTTSVKDSKITQERDLEKKDEAAKKRNEVASSDDKHAKNNDNQHKTDIRKSNTANKSKEPELNDNLMFYRGKINSKPPPGHTIKEMLEWKGNYAILERNHSYIQWLFPIPEGSGMNSSAQALQDHEAKAIREDSTLRSRVQDAYEMMLDFYGMKLLRGRTYKVERNSNWEKRYEHLNKSIHNHMRITRILKSLGELGWECVQSPWLERLMNEAALENGLPKLAHGNSMEYWISAIKDEGKRAEYFDRYLELKASVNERKMSENKKKGDKR